jgi:hypothetical protein
MENKKRTTRKNNVAASRDTNTEGKLYQVKKEVLSYGT